METTVAISLDFNITSQKQHVNLSKFNHLTFSFFFKQKISPYTKTKITLSEIISQFVPLWDCYQRGMAGETRYTKIRVTSSTMQKLDWRKGWDVHDKEGWCNVNSPIIACLLKKSTCSFPRIWSPDNNAWLRRLQASWNISNRDVSRKDAAVFLCFVSGLMLSERLTSATTWFNRFTPTMHCDVLPWNAKCNSIAQRQSVRLSIGRSGVPIHGHWVNGRSAPWARAFTTTARQKANFRLQLGANCRHQNNLFETIVSL